MNEATNNGAERIIIDGRVFKDKLENVIKIVKSQTSTSLSIIANEKTSLEEALEAGIEEVIAPENSIKEVKKNLEAAERSFIIKKIREL